jgi:hypothetical protein
MLQFEISCSLCCESGLHYETPTNLSCYSRYTALAETAQQSYQSSATFFAYPDSPASHLSYALKLSSLQRQPCEPTNAVAQGPQSALHDFLDQRALRRMGLDVSAKGLGRARESDAEFDHAPGMVGLDRSSQWAASQSPNGFFLLFVAVRKCLLRVSNGQIGCDVHAAVGWYGMRDEAQTQTGLMRH